MRSQKLSLCLLMLLFMIHWNPVKSLCSLDKLNSEHCHELEDARFTDTYQLLSLRAPATTKTITPGIFENLTSLQHLDLSGGKLQSIGSNAFAELESLKTLNLANNQINHLEIGAFDNLNQLRDLNLKNNEIKALPAALMNIKNLKHLDLANNPLDCDCASMKLRDGLLAKKVQMSKQTSCSTPSSAKNLPITKPVTSMICEFELQDREMQGDQAQDSDEGPGEEEAGEKVTEKPENSETAEKEKDVPPEVEENQEETAAPSVSGPTTASSLAPAASPTSDEVPSSSAVTKDDSTFETTEASEQTAHENEHAGKEEETENSLVSESVTEQPSSTEDAEKSSSTEETSKKTDDFQDLGSGEEDDGSGSEGSDIFGKESNITYSTVASDEETVEQSSPPSSTAATSGSSWLYYFDPLNFLGVETKAPEPTESAPTEKSPEKELKEEQFFEVATTTKATVEEPIAPPRMISLDESSQPAGNSPTSHNSPFETAYSKESNKGMSSYIVLAVLLAVLVMLIVIAAYKGQFCRKKSKRRDLEKGTEMKDMQKSLLEQNSNQTKIQITNGSTLENVPLMTPSLPPEEPKAHQRSYDITQSAQTNGSSNRSNGHTVDLNDPIKPPRKPTSQEIEAPLNGLNPPMDAIDGPTSDSESNDGMNGACCQKPPLSPGAQRVKITMNENPDSVVKTPLLITRISDVVTNP